MNDRQRILRLACYAACGALIALSIVIWILADKYHQTFVLKRMAAPLKYDDTTIGMLKHGRSISAVLLVAGLAAGAAGFFLSKGGGPDRASRPSSPSH